MICDKLSTSVLTLRMFPGRLSSQRERCTLGTDIPMRMKRSDRTEVCLSPERGIYMSITLSYLSNNINTHHSFYIGNFSLIFIPLHTQSLLNSWPKIIKNIILGLILYGILLILALSRFHHLPCSACPILVWFASLFYFSL